MFRLARLTGFAVLMAAPSLAWGQMPTVDTTPCGVAGAALLGDGEQANPYLAAFGGESLFVYQRPFSNGAHRVVRYALAADAGACTLTRDESFAGAGALERPGIMNFMGVVGDQLVVGDRLNMIYGLDGGERYTCDSISYRSRMAAVDATTALVTNGTTGVERWTFDGSACSSEQLWALPAGHQVGYSMTQWDGDVAGLYLLPEQRQTIVRLAPDGTERWRWSSNQASEPDYFGNVMSVAVVNDHLLVLDVGRRQIWVLDGAGALAGSTELPAGVGEHAAGVQYQHLLAAGPGLALLVYTHSANGVSSWGAVPVRM